MQGFYRQQAIGHARSAERLDILLTVTSARSWIVLAGLLALVVGFIFWSIFGRVPIEVAGEGELFRRVGVENYGGVRRIYAPRAGTIVRLLITPYANIDVGEPVAEIVTPDGVHQTIRSAVAGRALSPVVDVGTFLVPGMRMVSVVPRVGKLQALLLVQTERAKLLRAGMRARITPSLTSSQQYGYLNGTVTSVAQFPSSAERLKLLVDSDALLAQLTEGGKAVREVRIALDEDPAQPGKLAWHGPPLVEALDGGVVIGGSILTRNISPISLFLAPTK